VTSIGYAAFSYCAGLKEIHSKITTPISVNSSVFNFVNKTTCKLYVPKGSYSAYWLAPVWGDFINIIEEDATATAIATVNLNKSLIYPISNGIAIESYEMIPVAIFNLAGQKVYQATINGKAEIPLNHGVYIVRAGNESQKIIIK
jgi:hypothetical protein